MRRREFVTLVGGAAVSWSITSHAQQSNKTRLIGVLISYAESDRAAQSEVAAFRGGLAKLGWTEGSNLEPLTSALGQKQTSEVVQSISALPPKADIGTQPRDVRFVPKATYASDIRTTGRHLFDHHICGRE